MPTVILLDVSLSMSRPVLTSDAADEVQRRHLAVHGINAFLDYLSAHSRLEFVSLVIFSSLCEQVVPFTRDYSEIRAALGKVEEYSRTCLETALGVVGTLVVEEWGVSTLCQILLVTDGNTGIGETSIRSILHRYATRQPIPDDDAPLALTTTKRSQTVTPRPLVPFPFPCRLHVVAVTAAKDGEFRDAEPLFQQLAALVGSPGDVAGDVMASEGGLSAGGVRAAFTKLASRHFTPFVGTLHCGNLQCAVQLYPSPDDYNREHDFERVTRTVSKDLNICGFLDIADVSSPPHLSRHLVLPISATPAKQDATPDGNGKSDVTKDDTEEKDGVDKSAAFTVLLHGSLKVEGMVALVQFVDDWYGMMYSWADSKKKSNLMLSIFEPGVNVLPWLGSLSQLAPLSDFATPPYGEDDGKSPFPVMPAERRSYAQNCVVWIKNAGLQADIQKILRNARKLPEKQQHFYKELNRLRKAALALGFYELLEGTAQLLDRECLLLPDNAPPDAAIQMTHAAAMLRSRDARDVSINIQPPS